MTIWTTLDRVFPRNREGKWPLPVQFLVFLLFEALFIYGSYAVSNLVYSCSMDSWAANTSGIEHSNTVLTLLTTLIVMEICAWHTGLQRYITFGGNTPRRWTILPITLGYGALSLTTYLLSQLFLTMEIPLPTDNMMLCTVLHSILYVAVTAVFCALIDHLRRGEKKRAGLLAAAEIALVLLLTLCSACSGQIQQELLEEAYANPAAQQVTVTTVGVSEGEVTDELLAAILSHSGLDAEDVVIVPAEEVLSAVKTDPFAAFEEAMAPSNRLADILQWVQLIPIFFAMKYWLFPHDDMQKAGGTE